MVDVCRVLHSNTPFSTAVTTTLGLKNSPGNNDWQESGLPTQELAIKRTIILYMVGLCSTGIRHLNNSVVLSTTHTCLFQKGV